MNKSAKSSRIDVMCAAVAREIEDGDLVGQGISTPLVAAAYMLAKLTRAPNSIVTYTIGNAYSIDFFPLSLLYYEKNVIDHSLQLWSFADTVRDVVSHGRMDVELFRPAQIDMYGNTNNVVIGDYDRPTVRLPGCGGICDATTSWEKVYFYVPNHSRNVFVNRVDFRSGLGFIEGCDPRQRAELGLLGKGPTKVFTDLGVMDFDEGSGRMRLVSIHPSVSIAEIQENSSFEIIVPDKVERTIAPSEEEVRLLDERIDPYGIRVLESLSGAERTAKILEIVEEESADYVRRGSQAPDRSSRSNKEESLCEK